MNTKKWAVAFIVLISCGYVTTTALENAVFQSAAREKRSVTPCSIDPEVNTIVDRALDKCRSKISGRYKVQDHSTSEISIKSGSSEGWDNFVRSAPIIGRCRADAVDLVVEINFLSVTITYTLTLLENLLGGILGGILSGLIGTVTSLLDGITSLLLRILAVDIRVLIVLEQKLIPGAKCEVVSYKISRISNIKVLNLDLTVLANLLEGLLIPVMNLVLSVVLNGPIKEIFVAELSKIAIPLNLIGLSY